MKLVRKIISTSLISSLVFIILFSLTVAIATVMLRLKELSYQTVKVLSDWNTLDRVTNDVLYYRLDSLSRLSVLESSWLDASRELSNSFMVLRNNRLLHILPDHISGTMEEAWYLWQFSNAKLEAGQRIFNDILNNHEKGALHLIEIDRITFYEKLLYLTAGEDSYENTLIYRNFMAHMYVLDITGESFSRLLQKINEDIPDEINDYIYALLVSVGGILVLMILFSLYSARKVTKPILQMAAAVQRMGERDYPLNLDTSDGAAQGDEIRVIQEGFNRMAERIHALYDESLSKEREKRRAQFRALQYQINPHFLYNTLGALRMKAAMTGNEELAGNLLSLSRLLRSTISKSDSFILLSEEIKIMRDYLEVIQVRYKNRLSPRFSVEDDVLDHYVPALILQPLLENAVLHGLSARLNRSENDAVLEIGGWREGDTLLLSVTDNGCGMSEDQIAWLFHKTEAGTEKSTAHIGLSNIRDRLVLLFGEAADISVESVVG